jgi:hypothetical protein
MEMKLICSSIEDQEKHSPGGLARACIVTALHFDFLTAMGVSSHTDTVLHYREEPTNIQVLTNILKNLKDVKMGLGLQLTEQQAKEKLN